MARETQAQLWCSTKNYGKELKKGCEFSQPFLLAPTFAPANYKSLVF